MLDRDISFMYDIYGIPLKSGYDDDDDDDNKNNINYYYYYYSNIAIIMSWLSICQMSSHNN